MLLGCAAPISLHEKAACSQAARYRSRRRPVGSQRSQNSLTIIITRCAGLASLPRISTYNLLHRTSTCITQFCVIIMWILVFGDFKTYIPFCVPISKYFTNISTSHCMHSVLCRGYYHQQSTPNTGLFIHAYRGCNLSSNLF